MARNFISSFRLWPSPVWRLATLSTSIVITCFLLYLTRYLFVIYFLLSIFESPVLSLIDDFFDVVISDSVCLSQTLPPIKQQSVDDVRQKKKQASKMLKSFWPTPQPPKPFLLHLGVTARTHDISEFQQNFQDQYDHFFIDR